MNWLKSVFGGKTAEISEKHNSKVSESDGSDKLDKKSTSDICQALPWHGNDIYLEDANKSVKAVCSNPGVAKVLAECMECYSSLNAFEGSKTKAYAKFIQDAYYLRVALANAKIPVDSVATAFVEKAYHQFCKSLDEIISREKLTFAAGMPDCTPDRTPE